MSPCNSDKYCNSVTLLYKSSEQEHGRRPSDSVACLEYRVRQSFADATDS